MMNHKVIIIGAGLTGLVAGFYLKKRGVDFLIIEESDKPGGVIDSIEEDGFICEAGPNTGVIGNPEVAELFEDLGDVCQLEIANEEAKKRLILKNGRWEAIPSGLIGGIKTPLFSWKDKFRILAEPFRKPGSYPDENLSDLVKRRMGQSFLDYAVDPFIKGVYAGDTDYLIPRYALPKLYRLEQEYGSFIGGSIKKKKKEKNDDRLQKVTREVFSTKGGLAQLVKGLSTSIGEDKILTSCKDLRINKEENNFQLGFSNSEKNRIENADKIISTTGSNKLRNILSDLIDGKTIDQIDNLVYARVAEVALGFRKWEGIKLDSFGGLIPSKEKRRILGILFPSAFLQNRAPEGGALLTTFIGGMKMGNVLDLSDNDLMKIIEEEVTELMGLKSFAPDLVKIFRYNHAIPQYGITTGKRYAAIDKIESEYPGLFIGGNLKGGIGMADRIKQGRELAGKV